METYADRVKKNLAPQSISLPTLILIRGAPGAGKTVIADYFQTLGYTSLSVDDFLSHNGEYTFDSNDYKKSKISCHNRTENLLRIKRDVVVHNTFRTLNEIKPYLDLEKKKMCRVIVYHVVSQYASNKNVPDDIVTKHKERYQKSPLDQNITFDRDGLTIIHE